MAYNDTSILEKTEQEEESRCHMRNDAHISRRIADQVLDKQEVAKKRTRRVVKHQRAIVGASLEQIKERRAVRPEAREAARKQAIKDAKEKKAAAESKKKAEKAKNAAKGGAKPISKQGAKGAAPKVAAKSR
jgi:large subunit ribosomal protein L24e